MKVFSEAQAAALRFAMFQTVPFTSKLYKKYPAFIRERYRSVGRHQIIFPRKRRLNGEPLRRANGRPRK
ncbi:MAG: hypothetical protein KDF59_05210 [Nitrosomonas sp.]|nr:hypothetical protein [Nitrosomonas sp.]